MGELMRWRAARAAQRRVPAPVTLVQLGQGPAFTASADTVAKLQNIQNGPDAAEFASYSRILADTASLHRYLTSGNQVPASVIQAIVALLQLDEWLASTQNQPTVAALTSEVTGLLGQYLQTWFQSLSGLPCPPSGSSFAR
jgi:hypothetical protein